MRSRNTKIKRTASILLVLCMLTGLTQIPSAAAYAGSDHLESDATATEEFETESASKSTTDSETELAESENESETESSQSQTEASEAFDPVGQTAEAETTEGTNTPPRSLRMTQRFRKLR